MERGTHRGEETIRSNAQLATAQLAWGSISNFILKKEDIDVAAE